MNEKTRDLLMKLSGFLAGQHSYRELIYMIVSESAKIIGSDRACLILMKGDRFVIEGGFPEKDHGIGDEIKSGDCAFDLYMKILNNRVPAVRKSFDPDVCYLSGLVEAFHINSVLFLPLYRENEPLGLIIFDFVENHEIGESSLIIQEYLANMIAVAIWKESHREKANLALLGQYSAQTAHEIGNYLYQIFGSVEYIKEYFPVKRYEEDYEVIDMMGKIDIIWRASKRMKCFLQEMKSFSKIKKIDKELTDINKFISEKGVEIFSRGFNCEVRFDIDIDFENPIVRIDHNLISDSFLNIIINAIHEGATIITFKTQFFASDKKALISIINNGRMIDPGIMEKIFYPGFTTKDNGSGWGLINVRNIIEMHGGNVEVESDNKKTEFRIFLPLND